MLADAWRAERRHPPAPPTSQSVRPARQRFGVRRCSAAFGKLGAVEAGRELWRARPESARALALQNLAARAALVGRSATPPPQEHHPGAFRNGVAERGVENVPTFNPVSQSIASENASASRASLWARGKKQHPMNRKQFIESHGATCDNWNWSWSFINETEKVIIFGAWDRHTDGEKFLILTEDWKINARGRKSNGYSQSKEHVRLIEEEGYRLKTFPITYSAAKAGEDGLGPAKIEGFIPVITEKTLTRVGTSWYASDGSIANTLAEELTHPDKYAEGAQTKVTINAFERNSKARVACIAHHGVTCVACGFSFREVYGALGDGFIHVHHIIPIGSVGTEYEVDPVMDLVPVCPNCHAMIHRTEPPLTVKQRRAHLEEPRP